MWGDLYGYISSFGGWWWSITTITVPFVVNEALSSTPWYREAANRLARPEVRRIALFVLTLFAVFWAGFMAWRDEHTARLESEIKTQNVVKKLEQEWPKLPDSPDGLPKGAIWNNGGMLSIIQ